MIRNPDKKSKFSLISSFSFIFIFFLVLKCTQWPASTIKIHPQGKSKNEGASRTCLQSFQISTHKYTHIFINTTNFSFILHSSTIGLAMSVFLKQKYSIFTRNCKDMGSLEFLVEFWIFWIKFSQRHCHFGTKNRQNQPSILQGSKDYIHLSEICFKRESEIVCCHDNRIYWSEISEKCNFFLWWKNSRVWKCQNEHFSFNKCTWMTFDFYFNFDLLLNVPNAYLYDPQDLLLILLQE